MKINYSLTVEVQMLIRKPVTLVYQAMLDPAITTKFWFTKSSGPLQEEKTVTWTWEMYGASVDVLVKKILPNKKSPFNGVILQPALTLNLLHYQVIKLMS